MPSSSQVRCILLILFAWMLQAGQGVCPAADSPLVINEVMASNNSTVMDPQDEYDDWIEIHNMGTVSVDVAGMYVTDDLGDPTKWQFPLNQPELTTIAPGGFLLLWADGDTADPGLHASFNLSADGEEIGLFDSNGVTLVDSLSFGPQTVDISYGRYPDGASDWGFMGRPTPGDENVNTYAGIVAEPEFSHKRGFHDAAFTLELTTQTEEAAIYYRLDGVNPLVETGRGPAGVEYTGPIQISQTTCVRAAAVKSGCKSSATVTASYIFLENAIHQPAYPAGFPTSWGSTRVDYGMDPRVVNSPTYGPTIKDDLKTIPAVSVAKHSLRILFKNEYGPARLEYPLFEDSDVSR